MSYLNDLERLNALRESGGLTEEEFEHQKASILDSGPERFEQGAATKKFSFAISIGVAVGILLAGAAAYEFLPIKSRETSSPTVVGANSMEGVDAVTDNAVQAALPDRPFDKYAWATDVERVGQTAALVEQKLGAPGENSKSIMFYIINNCPVTYTIKHAKIFSIYMSVSDVCHPIIMGESVTPSMNFKSVDSLENGTIITDCLEQCGNVADPETTLWTQGPHSDLYLNRIYGTSLGDAVNKARDTWGVVYRRQRGLADNAEVNDRAISSCQSIDDDSVRNAIGPALVKSVTIGYNLPKC